MLVDRSSRHPPGADAEETLSAAPSSSPAGAVGVLIQEHEWLGARLCLVLNFRSRIKPAGHHPTLLPKFLSQFCTYGSSHLRTYRLVPL